MAPEESFVQLSLWKVNLCLQSYTICFKFILYFPVSIQIQISRVLNTKNTDPILIRIQNTVA